MQIYQTPSISGGLRLLEDYRPPLPSKIKKEPKVRGMPHQLVPTIVPSQRIIVETITTTMVTERRILGGITDNRINITATHANNPASSTAPVTSEEEEAPALPPKENQNRTLQTAEQPPDSSSLAGILKGGKLWKSETVSNVFYSLLVHCCELL